VILLQLQTDELKLENSDKLAINSQNFARVRLQLKFAFIIQALMLFPLLGPSCLPVM